MSALRTGEGECLGSLLRLDDCDVLRVAGLGDFCVGPDRIVLHPACPTRAEHPPTRSPPTDLCSDRDWLAFAENTFLGTVLSYWLELHGVPALHASAVAVAGRTLAFLATTHGGKSALAAAFMQAGHSLLTDDVLAVDCRDGVFHGRSGYPTMRMWPDEAEHFLGHYEDLDLVHPRLSKRRVPIGPDCFGTFCPTAQPLGCVYLPERRSASDLDSTIEITPVSPADAVIELVRNSFVPRLVAAVGLAPQRLRFFGELVEQVPVRRLVYPSGFEHLAAVQEAILRDLKTVGSREA